MINMRPFKTSKNSFLMSLIIIFNQCQAAHERMDWPCLTPTGWPGLKYRRRRLPTVMVCYMFLVVISHQWRRLILLAAEVCRFLEQARRTRTTRKFGARLQCLPNTAWSVRPAAMQSNNLARWWVCECNRTRHLLGPTRGRSCRALTRTPSST